MSRGVGQTAPLGNAHGSRTQGHPTGLGSLSPRWEKWEAKKRSSISAHILEKKADMCGGRMRGRGVLTSYGITYERGVPKTEVRV